MHAEDQQYINKWFYILGIYQLLGGLLGIYVIIITTTNFQDFSLIIILLNLIIIGLFAWSILCGITLIRKKNIGLKYSRINQYIQLVTFFAGRIGFSYVAGVSFSMGLNLSGGFRLNFDAGISGCIILFANDKNIVLLNVNLIALLALVMINSLTKMIADDEVKLQIEQIGKE